MRGRRPPWYWRWIVVGVGVALLASLPAVVAAVPAHDLDLSAADVLALVRGSNRVPYQGYAEGRAGLGLPDLNVPGVGQVVSLLGSTTKLRAWVASPMSWRVDMINAIGEQDDYRDGDTLWQWNSDTRRATRTHAEASVRLPRPSDLLPPELGRRMASEATVAETRRIGAQRVAGVDALGIRMTPTSTDTTVAYVDLWADPSSGLPVRVHIVPRGESKPIVLSQFLELRRRAPSAERVTFTAPPDAIVDVQDVPDVVAALNRFSPFVLPPEVGGLNDRGDRGPSATTTYGKGFAVVAVAVIPSQYIDPRNPTFGDLPQLKGPWGTAPLLETPLLKGMVVGADPATYVIAGAVTVPILERIVTDLTAQPTAYRNRFSDS